MRGNSPHRAPFPAPQLCKSVLLFVTRSLRALPVRSPKRQSVFLSNALKPFSEWSVRRHSTIARSMRCSAALCPPRSTPLALLIRDWALLRTSEGSARMRSAPPSPVFLSLLLLRKRVWMPKFFPSRIREKRSDFSVECSRLCLQTFKAIPSGRRWSPWPRNNRRASRSGWQFFETF